MTASALTQPKLTHGASRLGSRRGLVIYPVRRIESLFLRDSLFQSREQFPLDGFRHGVTIHPLEHFKRLTRGIADHPAVRALVDVPFDFRTDCRVHRLLEIFA